MVVGDVGDVDGKLMIDGVDVHAMIFLIALMFYSHSLAVSPTSSLARGPPISEDLKCARWKVSPIKQWWGISVHACAANIDTRSGYVFCDEAAMCQRLKLGEEKKRQRQKIYHKNTDLEDFEDEL